MSKDSIIGRPTPPDEAAPDESGPERADPDAVTTEAIVDAGDPATAFARARVYALLALGFERPGDDLADALAADAFTDDLVDAASELDGDVERAARAVAGSVDDVDALRGEWASLFGVEEGVSVSPYELTYLPGPLVTNVRQLADVTGFYSAFGLDVAPEKNDRGDHICFEAEFLHHLALREARLRAEGDDEGVTIVVSARREFVEDHFGRWFWRIADEVSHADDHGFYAALADLLAALLEDELDRLAVDPDWVPDDPEAAAWTDDIFGETGRTCGGCGIDAGGPGGGDGASIPHGHLFGDQPTSSDDR